jgi:copper chaperone
VRDFPTRCRKSRSTSAPLAGQSIASCDRRSNVVLTLSRMKPTAPSTPHPVGVMKWTWLRLLDMNDSKRTDTILIETTRLSIGGMSCGACVRHVTRALDGLTGVLHVAVDLDKHEATVEHLPDWVGETGTVVAIKDAGYQARVIARDTGSADIARSAPARRSTGCCCSQ